MNARESSDRIASLLSRERHAMADFLVALSEFDAAGLWAELGHGSLFAYLHRELKLSAGAAYLRKSAAELVRRFPPVLDALRDGRLCLSTVGEAAKVLTSDNVGAVLPRFFGLSAREAAALALSIRPVESPPIQERVTRFPGARAETAPPVLAPAREAERAFHTSEVPAPGAYPAAVARFDTVARSEPLSATLRRLHLTTTQAFLDKVETARNGMSHVRPNATTEQVLDAALDHLLEHQAKRRGATDGPARRRRPSQDDHIPAEVRRAVFLRDGGCCQWPVEAGGVCGSRRRIQFDHVVPRARGGASTVDNVRLLCRFHNQRAARLVFGDACMDRFTRNPVAQEPMAAYALRLRPVPGADAPGTGLRSG